MSETGHTWLLIGSCSLHSSGQSDTYSQHSHRNANCHIGNGQHIHCYPRANSRTDADTYAYSTGR